MNSLYDTIHEAIRVAAAAVGNPDENRPAAEVAVDAVKLLGDGQADDWQGWQALAMGFVNLTQILLSDRMDGGEAPLDVLRSCADRFPRH